MSTPTLTKQVCPDCEYDQPWSNGNCDHTETAEQAVSATLIDIPDRMTIVEAIDLATSETCALIYRELTGWKPSASDVALIAYCLLKMVECAS